MIPSMVFSLTMMDRDLVLEVSTSQLNSQFRYKLVDLSNGDVTDLTPNWTHYGKSQDGNVFTGSLSVFKDNV